MAQRTTVVLVDDLDGESEATETIKFGWLGVEYSIDLNAENAAGQALHGMRGPTGLRFDRTCR